MCIQILFFICNYLPMTIINNNNKIIHMYTKILLSVVGLYLIRRGNSVEVKSWCNPKLRVDWLSLSLSLDLQKPTPQLPLEPRTTNIGQTR